MDQFRNTEEARPEGMKHPRRRRNSTSRWNLEQVQFCFALSV
jgi:hypothetical protein